MPRRSDPAGDRLQVLQFIGSAMAVVMGLLALLYAVRAGLAPERALVMWFSCVLSAVAGLALVGVVRLAGYGYEQMASWLLVAVVALRLILEATVTAPHAYGLLWPLYIVPIIIAQILLGSRAGGVAGLGAIPMFVFGYFGVADKPALVARMDETAIVSLLLYVSAAALVHVALARMAGALRQAEQVAGSHDRARAELREREEQFRALAESSATGIVIHQDGRLVYGNPYFFEMAHCRSSDGFGLSLWDFFDESGVEELRSQLMRRRTLKGSVPPNLLTFKPLKGPTRWCEVAVAEAMFWQKPATVANVLDVTERVQAEMEVQRERDFSNNIIDTAGAIIMALDAQGHVLRFNPAGEQITGYTAAEVLGRPYWEVFFPPERQEEGRAIFADIQDGAPRGHREVVWPGKHDDEITISWHYVGQYGPEGALAGIVCTGIDVTQQRNLEHQAVVTEGLRSLGQISGGVAHDLNNMLASIIGPADLLLMEEEDPGKQRALNSILAAATRGAETVRRIQSFSKARTDLDRQVFDLRELVEEVVFSLRPRWRDAAQKQGLSIRIHDEVPRGLMVHASAGEMGNVLMNLILNACEAMTRDGDITISAEQQGEVTELQVRDTGSGMSPETMTNIFKPFFSTKGADNTGLGLAVIHGIILRHGGTIAVDSELGQGTTFRITLPASAPTEAHEPPAPREETPRGLLRILVVDDMPDIADYIATIAMRNGHEAVKTYTGEDALHLLETGPFDLLITDYGMEGLSGVKLAEKAHHLQPGIKVVLVTGWDVSIDEFEGLDGLLQKPFTREQIEGMLRSLTA